MLKTLPTYVIEQQIQAVVAGVDEAGRGAFSGPVVAAAVILVPTNIPAGIDDSKRLSPKKRAELYNLLIKCSEYAVGMASPQEIDEHNILVATKMAMQRAVNGLRITPGHVLIDGRDLPTLAMPATPVIQGDRLSLSIAAASIIAKVTRDTLMQQLAQQHPAYGWEHNAGYGTAAHISALKQHGPCKWHRLSFAPLRELATR